MRHRQLGQTLDLFLTQDAESYNFQNLQSIYLLRYTGVGTPDPMTIIGATSPSTLFVTPANNMDFLNGQIRWGNHNALSSDPNTYQPLNDRDPEFIIWFYALSKAMPQFAVTFAEVNAYLKNVYGILPHNLQNRINALLNTTYNSDYLPLELAAGVPIEVLGFGLRKKQRVVVSDKSDFAIASTKPIVGDVPLVLPNGLFTYNWTYITSQWNPNIRVEDTNAPLGQRVLPAENVKWPYLTMADFLEPTIIEMGSQISSNDFFNGNLRDNTSQNPDVAYLLPIKKRYFDYFTTEDLKRNLSMSIENVVGGGKYVKVVLKIPVKGGREIVYEKNYMPFSGVNDGSGLIDQRQFTLALFPCTRFTAGTQADYRIMYMSLDRNWEPALSCYNDAAQSIKPASQTDRNKDTSNNLIDSTAPVMPMYAIDQPFEYIELNDGKLSGIAIPLWRGNSGGAAYHFAVDFGTTNTHIEYRVGTNSPRPLNVEIPQLAVINTDAYRNVDYNISLFNCAIPNSINSNDEVHFPMRTVMLYKKHTDWNQPYSPYITGNIPFYYGIHQRGANNDIEYDLKWSNSAGNVDRINCYLSSLLMLMRNKVVMEGGALSQTKITWFYPTSMPAHMVASIDRVWQSLFTRYFGGSQANIVSIPESIAPYKYYQRNFGAGIDVLTIDIGGGTTDAMIVDHDGTPAFITSFRFAANSLFGDAFTDGGGVGNGFVDCFKPRIESILDSNNLNGVKDILQEVATSQPSADLISFFFTLKDNIDVKKKGVSSQLDFLNMMSNSSGAKTLMLIFYTAIIYHLAQFIKGKKAEGANIGEPAYLAFSGNGSKLLQILGAGTAAGTAMLSDYTVAIFEKVMGCKYPHTGIKFVTDYNSPKEATSRGGLDTVNVPSAVELGKMIQTLLGTSDDRFVSSTELYSELTEKEWNDLERSINDFTELFFTLANEKNTENIFGTVALSKLQQLKSVFSANTKVRTRSALNYFGLLNQPVKIENTLFFYPITNILHDLAQKIMEK